MRMKGHLVKYSKRRERRFAWLSIYGLLYLQNHSANFSKVTEIGAICFFFQKVNKAVVEKLRSNPGFDKCIRKSTFTRHTKF